MLLAIDIGNSSTKLGIFDNEKLIKRVAFPSDAGAIATGFSDCGLKSEITNQKSKIEISAVFISSVVPELHDVFEDFCQKHFNVAPVFIDHTFDLGLIIKYHPPESLGIDRLICAAAAANKYGTPCIVCDFGTATTIDVVNSKREFLGGVITPGIRTLAESLYLKTAKLPHVEIERAESVIGNTTARSIRSGVFYGYIGLVEGILKRMQDELSERPKIMATGGFANLIAENCTAIDIVDENLILEGLQMNYLNFSL